MDSSKTQENKVLTVLIRPFKEGWHKANPLFYTIFLPLQNLCCTFAFFMLQYRYDAGQRLYIKKERK